MMPNSIPKVAIVGRPNVGKSALFNRIVGKRLAIVDSAEGVTRDRQEAMGEIFDREFLFVDTGGIDPCSEDPYAKQIADQAILGALQANVVILVVDSTVGVSALDQELAHTLHKTLASQTSQANCPNPKKKILLAINKVDHIDHTKGNWEFQSLGIDKMFPVSSLHGRGVMELLEAVISSIDWDNLKSTTPPPSSSIRLAVIGRPNVGKSTFVNSILSAPRCIVSDEAGTTRDAIDCEIEVNGTDFTLIDTAGIRRIPKQKDVIEKFAHIRTQRALERCDIALLMLNSLEGMTTQEKRIAKEIDTQGRGCILFLNKWDLTNNMRMEHAKDALYQELPFLRHCPLIIGSALTKRNVLSVFKITEQIMQARSEKIPTGQLNSLVEKAIQKNHPPMIKGKRLRIYYLTQVAQDPPTFKLFINHEDLMHSAWKRYLIAQLRGAFNLKGLPVRLLIEDKAAKKLAKAMDK